MDNGKSPWAKIDRQLEGEPMAVGDRTLQAVGHLQGWQMNAGDGSGGFSSLVARLKPLEVVVREGDDEYRVAVVDPQQEPLRGILMAGVAVCVGCMFIMLIVHLLARRRAKS